MKRIVLYVDIYKEENTLTFHGYLYDTVNQRKNTNKMSGVSYNGREGYISRNSDNRALSVPPDIVFDGFNTEYIVDDIVTLEWFIVDKVIKPTIVAILDIIPNMSDFTMFSVEEIIVIVKSDINERYEINTFSNITVNNNFLISNIDIHPVSMLELSNLGFQLTSKIKQIAHKGGLLNYIKVLPSYIYYDTETNLHAFMRDVKFVFFHNDKNKDWKRNREYYSVLYDDAFSTKPSPTDGKFKKRITGEAQTGYYTLIKLNEPVEPINSIMEFYSNKRAEKNPLKTLNTLNVKNVNIPAVRSLMKTFNSNIFDYNIFRNIEYLSFDESTMIVNRVSPSGMISHTMNNIFPEMNEILSKYTLGMLKEPFVISDITNQIFNNGDMSNISPGARLVTIKIRIDENLLNIPLTLGDRIVSRFTLVSIRKMNPVVSLITRQVDRKRLIYWFVIHTKSDNSYMIWRTAQDNYIIVNPYSEI